MVSENSSQVRILIIDDEIGFTDILSKRMARRGIDSVKANSGAEAIQVLRWQNFDAALLDLKMEDMDGIDVLKIFKKMVPKLPVIMLTGHGCQESAEEGMALGAADYLIKPCDLEELVAKIHAAIAMARKEEGVPRENSDG